MTSGLVQPISLLRSLLSGPVFFGALFFSSSASSQTKLATFKLSEQFGVHYPAQPVAFDFGGGSVDRANTKLVDESGGEVPFQQLSTGHILTHIALPGSLVTRTTVIYGDADLANDRLRVTAGQSTQPQTGDAVCVQGTTLPGGLTANTTYFIRSEQGDVTFYRDKARTDKVDITSYGSSDCQIIFPGLVLDPGDVIQDTFYRRSHGLISGSPIVLRTSGALPAPLMNGTTYYVISLTVDTFRLASTKADALSAIAINLVSSGSGYLEAASERTLSLVAGAAATALPSLPVSISDMGNCFEVTNGLTGFRVLKPPGNPAPYTKVALNGVRLGNGSWVAREAVFRSGDPSSAPVSFMTGYNLGIIESGPLKAEFLATYNVNGPGANYAGFRGPIVATNTDTNEISIPGDFYYFGPTTSMQFHSNGGTLPCGMIENTLYWPLTRRYDQVSNRTIFVLTAVRNGTVPLDLTCAHSGSPQMQEVQVLPGPTTFRQRITLFANQHSILVEDDSQGVPMNYWLNFRESDVFEPDQVRQRAHTISDKACGYSFEMGSTVKGRGYEDVFIDLSLSQSRMPSYYSSSSTFGPITNWYMANSGVNTGYYQMLYEKSAGPSSPLVALHVGRASRTRFVKAGGPTLYHSPAISHTGVYGGFGFRSADGTAAQAWTREYGIFVGTKADLRSVTAIQPVNIELNCLTGVNLSAINRLSVDIPDPVGGFPPPYMDQANWNSFVSRVQSDANFRSAVTTAGYGDLVPFLQAPSFSTAERVISALEATIFHWANILTNDAGIFHPAWHYYQPGLWTIPELPKVLALLNSNVPTPSQRRRLKNVAAFIGGVLWDNDYVPWDYDSGEGLGNANQAAQYSMYRALSALMLPTHPLLGAKQTRARSYTESIYDWYLHPVSGAPRGSTHYHGAAMDPALAGFLMMKNNGFELSAYTRWNRYGKWLLQILTPPEPRFGNRRYVFSLGDGNTEAQNIPGLLATLLGRSDPALARELQWGWNAQGSPSYSFTLPTVLASDLAAAAQAPQLASERFEGYFSVLRQKFNTPNETVAWLISGDWYSDHRHSDAGQVTMYAHAAPLTIDWNPNLYYPQVAGGFQHSSVTLESAIGTAWDTDRPPLSAGGVVWNKEDRAALLKFRQSSIAESVHYSPDLSRWSRRVVMVDVDPKIPLLYVRDTFSGPNVTQPKVLTWNLMATGSVDAPGGRYTPIERLCTSGTSTPNELPSAGPVRALAPGLNRLMFIGQYWSKHPTGGIDWDLYLQSNEDDQYLIGNWGHDQHSSAAMAAYLTANGAKFSEKQHILRVRSSKSFGSIFIPYRKGERPADLSVNLDGTAVVASWGKNALSISPDGMAHDSENERTITAFGDVPYSSREVAISGGPLEIRITANTLSLRGSGPAGTRTFTFAYPIAPAAELVKQGNVYTWNYDGSTSELSSAIVGDTVPPNPPAKLNVK